MNTKKILFTAALALYLSAGSIGSLYAADGSSNKNYERALISQYHVADTKELKSFSEQDLKEFKESIAARKPERDFEWIDKNKDIYILEQHDPANWGKDKSNESALQSWISSLGAKITSYNDADDKEEFVKQQAHSYASGMINSSVTKMLKQVFISDEDEKYIQPNVQFGFGINTDVRNHDLMTPQGKILVPFLNDPKYTFYTQAGITRAPGDRTIAHGGFGVRVYPEASSYSEVGSYMWGLNAVYDHDLDRSHRRMSLGAEFMTERFFIATNWYQRLSGWRGSYDYDSDYVQERPANGFDVHTKIFLPTNHKLALTGSVTHWLGDDVAPFGNYKHLEDNPWIFSAGLEWNPVPAITLSYKHEMSDSNRHNENFAINFNVPFGASFEDAFLPSSKSYHNGMKLASSRTMFIERNYTMPLQYRATPGKFHISYCGLAGTNTFCFQLTDGLNRHRSGVVVTVTPDNSSVIFNNGGSYVSDGAGKVYAHVETANTLSTDVTVTAEKSSARFSLHFVDPSMAITSEPSTIMRADTSLIVMQGSVMSAGYPVTWTLKGPGTLSDQETTFDSTGRATAVYNPNTTAPATYTANVSGTYNNSVYTAPVKVMVYGADQSLSANSSSNSTKVEAGLATPIYITDLNPGSTSTITVSGDATISTSEDGSGAATEITVVADEDGKATIYIIGDDVDDGSATVTIVTDDPYNDPFEKTYTIYSYVPTITVPTAVAPASNFTVSISGLKAGTTVSLTSADHADLTSSNTVTVPANGTITATYKANEDYYTGVISGITATYYRNNVDQSAAMTADDIAVSQFTIAYSQTSYTISGNDTATLTVTGGSAGVPVYFNIESGDGTITDPSSYQTVFDNNGEAQVTVQGISPYQTTIVVRAEAFNQTIDATVAFQDYGPTVTLPSLSNVYGDFSATVDPQVSTESGYQATYAVNVTGLKPNTVITNVTGATSDTFNVDAEGKVTITYPRPDYSQMGQTRDVAFTYYKNSAETETYTATGAITVYSYTLGISVVDTTLMPEQSTTVTVSGGKPNLAVSWSITGDGTVDGTNFDSTGKATATVTSVDPFTSALTVTAANAISDQSISIALSTLTMTLTVDPEAIKHNGTAVFTVTGNGDEYFNGRGVTWTILSGNGTVNSYSGSTTTVMDSSGVATVNYRADTTATSTYTATVQAKVGVLSLSQDVTVNIYGTSSTSTITVGSGSDNMLSGTTETVTVSGLEPGSTVTVTATGDGLVGESGTGSSGTADITVDSSGTATFVVTASDTDSGSITLTITTDDPYITPLTKTIGVFSYIPTALFSASSVAPAGTVALTITGLQPNSTITVTTPDYASVSSSDEEEEEEELSAFWAAANHNWLSAIEEEEEEEPGSTSTYTADSSGKVVLYLRASRTHYTGNIGDVKISYVRNAEITDAVLNAGSVDIKDFTPHFEDADMRFSGDDIITLTLVNGSKNVPVTFEIVSGNGTLLNAQDKFDENGQATVQLQGVSPYYGSVTVKATSFDKETYETTAYVNYTPTRGTRNNGGSGNEIEPMDSRESGYQSTFGVEIMGLLPGSVITNVTGATSSTFTADSDGMVTITYPRPDYSQMGESITVEFDYLTNSATTEHYSGDTYTVKTYSQTLTANASRIASNSKSRFTLSGSKSSLPVSWTVVSGNGEDAGHDSTVASDGTAIGYVRGVSPYTGDVTLQAETYIGAVQVTIPVTDLGLVLTISPDTIQRHQSATVTLTASDSTLDGETVNFSIISGTGTLSSTSATLDSSTGAQISFSGDNSATDTYTATIQAEIAGATTEQSLTVRIYGTGQYNPHVVDDGTPTLEPGIGKDIVYEDLEPGSTVHVDVGGDGHLDDGSTSKDYVVGDDGTVTVHVDGDDVDEGTIVVTITTEDPLQEPKNVNLDVKSYVPVITVPDSVAPNRNYTVEVTGLKSGTAASFSNADHATSHSSDVQVGSDGTLEGSYTSASDVFSGSISGATLTYYRNALYPTQSVAIPDIDIGAVTLSFEKDNQTFVGSYNLTYILEGGTEGVAVAFSIASGDATIVSADDSFDETGKAMVIVAPKSDGTQNAVIRAHTYGSDYEAVAEYASYTATVTLPTLTNIYGTFAATVEPALTSERGYKSYFTVEVSGLRPGSVITNVTGARSNSYTVDSLGEATIRYNTPDYTQQGEDIEITFTYPNSTRGTATYTGSVHVYEFNLGLTASRSEIVSTNPVILSFTGGKPYAPVSWETTGNSSASSSSSAFDSTGLGTATIVGTDPFTGQAEITATTGAGSLNVTLPVENVHMALSANPQTLERYETSDVTLTLSGLDGYYNGQDVTWSLEGEGSLSASSTVVGADDKTEITYQPSHTPTSSYTATVTATLDTYSVSLPLNVVIYGVQDASFHPNGSTELEGTETREVVYEDLKPGSEITITIDGDGSLSTDGTSSSGSSITVTADEDGKATFYVIADDVDSGSITVTADTPDPYLDPKVVHLTVLSYTPTFTLPDEVTPNKGFTVLASGLKPGTAVSFKESVDHLTLVSSSSIADASGQASAVYFVEKEWYYPNVVSGITLEHYHNIENPAVSANVADIPVKEYTPTFSMSPYEVMDDNEVTLVLENGYRGIPVTWEITDGDGVLLSVDSEFDDYGKAYATFKGVAPAYHDATIKVTSFNKVHNGTVHYKTFVPTITMPTLTNIYGTYADTVDPAVPADPDYVATYKVELTDMHPDLSVTDANANADTYEVDSSGAATMVYTTPDYSEAGTDRTISFKYWFTKFEQRTATASLHVNSYTLTQDTSTLDAYNGNYTTMATSTLTIRGGKPGSAVTWSDAAGHGDFSDMDSVFDATGAARAKVTAKTPFTTNPSIKASGVGTSKVGTVTYALTTFTPGFTWPSYTNSAYSTVANQIDTDQAYTVTLSNLLPGSSVTASCTYLNDTATKTVGTDGKVTFSYRAVNSVSVASVTHNFTYLQKGAVSTTVTKTLAVHRYNLSASANVTSITGDGTSTITVTGGKPYYTVTWSISGSGAFNSHSATFNAQGNATAVIRTVSPYNSNVTVTAKMQ